jgi:hypothetical protein
VSASVCSTLRGPRPWHVGTLFARKPGDLLLGRLSYFQSGPHREDEESKPMKNEQEKSVLFLVAMKLALPRRGKIGASFENSSNGQVLQSIKLPFSQCKAAVSR